MKLPKNKEILKSDIEFHSQIYKDGTYLKKNSNWHQEDSLWKSAQIAKLLSLNGINPKTFCEVGCGAGGVLKELSFVYKESELYGFEISPQAYKLSKSNASERVHFKFGDIFEKDHNFDILLCLDVFEHVPNYIDFISKLKPLGEFKVFHIPLDISVLSVLSGRMTNSRSSMGHLHYFTAESAIYTLKDCGYNILGSFYTAGFLRPSRSVKLSSKIARLPRKFMHKLSPRLTAKFFGGCSLLVLAK